MRILIGALVVLALATSAMAQPVTELPEVSGKCYLTVVYGDLSTQLEARLQQSLTNPTGQLFSLSSQCIFNEWRSSDPIVQKTDWAKYLGTSRPVLLLQGRAEKGSVADVIYVASGAQLHNPKLVRANVSLAIQHYKRWLALPTGQRGIFRRQRCGPQGCPVPRPRGDVNPQPNPQTKPPKRDIRPIVDIDLPQVDVTVPSRPDEEPASEGFPLWLLLFPLLGGGAGLYSHLKNQE
jgi:hypothetical protein